MTRRIVITAAGLTIAAVMLYAAATVPQIWVSAAIPGDAGRIMHTVVIDPPLTLTKGADGNLHLGIDTSSGTVVAEVPRRGARGEWFLSWVPINEQATCTRNGLVQQAGLDYLLDGIRITSSVWLDDDTYSCSYSYARPVAGTVAVVGEAPHKANPPVPGEWYLNTAPDANGATCTRNGLAQLAGRDYVVTAHLITSVLWADVDRIVCTYAYVRP